MVIGSGLRATLATLGGAGVAAVAVVLGLSMLPPAERPPPPPPAALDGAAPSVGAPAPVPRFDTVRFSTDGQGLVAGRAGPGATVQVLAGGEVAAEVTADAEGLFVAFLDLAPSAEARALSLRDGDGGLSEETVILAPMAAARVVPEAVAEAPATPLPSDNERAGPAPAVVAGQAAAPEPPAPSASDPREGGGGPGALAGPEDLAAVAAAPPPPEPASRLPTPTPDPEEGTEAVAAEAPAAPDLPSDRPVPDLALEDGSAPPALHGATAPAPPGPVAGEGPEGPSPETGTVEGALGLPTSNDGPVPSPGAAGPAVASAAPGEPASANVPEPAPQPSPLPAVVALAPDLAAPTPEAPGQAAVLISDSRGVRILQPALAPGADPEILATVALDAIAYDGAGEVTLSGRAAGGGAVRLYLDNRPVAEAPVGQDGQWSAALIGAAPGVYTLRIDQIDAAGEVVSRIETPFQREEREDLAAAMAAAQVAGQTIALRVVQPGNTLWAIARDRYGEPLMYVRVFEANRDRIRDPDLIYPGQVFVLPATEGR